MQAIVVIGYNRPGYFEKVMEGLAGNPETHQLPVYFFLDGGSSSRQKEYCDIIESHNLPRAKIVLRPSNWGCGRNIIEARREIFDTRKYQEAIIFEDDLVPNSTYIGTVFAMLKEFPGAVCQAWTPDTRPREEKLQAIGEVKISKDNFWGYALTRQSWNKIRKMLYYYQDNFLKGRYKDRDDKAIRAWIRSHTDRPYFNRSNTPTGQDAVTNLALWRAKIPRYTTTVNYGIYIGENGIHATPAIFTAKGFRGVSLDPLPVPKEFK